MSAIDRRSNVVLDSPPLVYPDVIAQNAKYFGSKACVVCGDERLTWAELDARTNQVANALIELGLEHGDRVCLHMSTSIAMFELMLGTVKAGGVTVPLNVMMAKESLPLMIENAGGPFVFTDESLSMSSTRSARPSPCRTIGSAQSAAITTAGFAPTSHNSMRPRISGRRDRTGRLDQHHLQLRDDRRPEGHRAQPLRTADVPARLRTGLRIDRYATTLCATPLYTNGTWIVMLPTLYAGGTVVLMPKFTPRGLS